MGGTGEDFEYMCRVFLLYLCSCSVDEAPAAAAAAPVTVKADAKVEETKAAKIVTVLSGSDGSSGMEIQIVM